MDKETIKLMNNEETKDIFLYFLNRYKQEQEFNFPHELAELLNMLSGRNIKRLVPYLDTLTFKAFMEAINDCDRDYNGSPISKRDSARLSLKFDNLKGLKMQSNKVIQDNELNQLEDIRRVALELFQKIEDLRNSREEVEILYEDTIPLYNHIWDMLVEWGTRKLEDKKLTPTNQDKE